LAKSAGKTEGRERDRKNRDGEIRKDYVIIQNKSWDTRYDVIKKVSKWLRNEGEPRATAWRVGNGKLDETIT